MVSSLKDMLWLKVFSDPESCLSGNGFRDVEHLRNTYMPQRYCICDKYVVDNYLRVSFAKGEGKGKLPAPDRDWRTTLAQYELDRRLEPIFELIAHKIGIDALDENNETPIFYAVQQNMPEIVALLVQNDANIVISNRNGLTPLQIAMRLGFYQVARALSIDKAADAEEFLPITQRAEIITTGADGIHGSNGSAGYGAGVSGGAAEDGERGKPARPINVRLFAGARRIYVEHQECEPVNAFQQRLGDPANRIFMEAHGGSGGDGGQGGRGGPGAEGRRGKDATRHSSGTNGGPGGPGGSGGRGGDGGAGGRGGAVELHMFQQDADLVMLSNIPDVSGGDGGQAGRGGAGGAGGPGGSGGSSYTYTTTRRVGNQTYTDYHYKSGGRSGPRGRSGAHGPNGRAGVKGHNGTFNISVYQDGAMRTYRRPYDLKVLSVRIEDHNGDGIIEPGDHVRVRLRVQNTGGMPTPTHQRIHLFLRNNDWLGFSGRLEDEVVVPRSLEAGEIMVLSHQRLPVTVRDLAGPQVGRPLQVTTRLELAARVSRVNKCFQQVDAQRFNIQIEQPVVISEVQGPLTITQQEEAPFSYRLTNVSKRSLGRGSDQQRRLHTRFQLEDGSDVGYDNFLFRNRDGKTLSLNEWVTAEVETLEPEESRLVTGMICFADEPIEPYSKARFRSTLSLASQFAEHDPTALVDIQQRRYELQIAEAYRPDADSTHLLVTNHRVSKEEIAAWERIAVRIGKAKLAFWNLSLYGGFNLFHTRLDHGRLVDEFRGKTVIILNNSIKSTRGVEGAAMDSIDFAGLFQAAIKANISCYVVGGEIGSSEIHDYLIPDEDVPMTPLAGTGELVRRLTGEGGGASSSSAAASSSGSAGAFTVPITDSYIMKSPGEKNLKEKAEKLRKKLRQKQPDDSFVCVYNYKREELEASFLRKKFSLGTVDVYPSLDPARAFFSSYRISDAQVHNPETMVTQHLYNILKIMSFEQKLERISNHAAEDPGLLLNAIVSDLADEQHAFRSSRGRNGVDGKDIKAGLENLQALCEYPVQNTAEEEVVLRALQHNKILAQKLCSKTDKVLLARRGYDVTKVTLEMIKKRKGELYFLGEKERRAIKKQVKQELKAYKSRDILEAMQNPLVHDKSVYFQNNWMDENWQTMSRRKFLAAVRKKQRKSHKDVVEGAYLCESDADRDRLMNRVEHLALKTKK